LKRAGEDIPEAKGLLLCCCFVVALSLLCHCFVVALSLLRRCFVNAEAVALSMLKPSPTKSACVFLWVLCDFLWVLCAFLWVL